MNSLVGILSREHLSTESPLTILWTPTDNNYFYSFIQKLGHTRVGFDHLYFGRNSPHLIICNNKASYYEKCRAISIQFHIPCLVVDHEHKSDVIDTNKLTLIDSSFPCSYKIAVSKEISQSWGSNHHQIISYDSRDPKNIELWRNIIFQTCKMIFKYNG